MMMVNLTGAKKPTVIVCTHASDIPKEKHWAIIETRSETKRGYSQGDPDESFSYVVYTAYLDHLEWQMQVIALTEKNHTAYNKVIFTAVEVKPATVSTSVAVSVNTD